ncbi:periplasmic chaperone for outer membrane proteins SurA [Desulfatibacillum alkenivorans DSM 16219]|uniref:Periplasmic chaperone for outer membrane proteins SurA n=2 Tax=Desulfatibacillum alkenivorans TaxID=259354 RepID=A0A1M7A8I1_9BACT|nr:periplasmic chaperone for outer membrane proteins SurA [Desulfatibacillum alkenivorans DSM 16219]
MMSCMKKNCLTALFSTLLTLMTVVPSFAEGELVDRIVAIVNTDVIMLSELNEKMAPIVAKIDAAGLPDEQREKTIYQYREDILSSMVSSLLVEQESEKLGVKVLEGEVNSYLERFKQSSHLTDEALRAQLDADGISMELFRNQIHDTILFQKLKTTEVDSKIVITDKEVQDYYNEHIDQYEGKKSYHLRYILLPYPENAAEEQKAAVEKTMGEIIAMYKAGESFPALIEKVSHEKIGGSGGDLGFFKAGDLTKDLSEKVKTMKPGDITEPMTVDLGLQIFWLEETEMGEGTSLEDAHQEIQELLYNEEVKHKYEKWVSELEDNSYVKIIR